MIYTELKLMDYKIRNNEEVMIRTYENVDKIKFCHHIEIHGQRMFNEDNCEYIQSLELKCLVCQKNFDVTILVN